MLRANENKHLIVHRASYWSRRVLACVMCHLSAGRGVRVSEWVAISPSGSSPTEHRLPSALAHRSTSAHADRMEPDSVTRIPQPTVGSSSSLSACRYDYRFAREIR
jgi:hypothetical protein